MNDEELRDLIRSAVPEHGDAFWTVLDRRLSACAEATLRVLPDPPAGLPVRPDPVAGLPVRPDAEGPQVLPERAEGMPCSPRPRIGDEQPGSPLPLSAAPRSAAIPMGANSMSYQQSSAGRLRGAVRNSSGLTRLAVAATAVTVAGGLFVGLQRAPVLTGKAAASWQPGGSATAAGRTGGQRGSVPVGTPGPSSAGSAVPAPSPSSTSPVPPTQPSVPGVPAGLVIRATAALSAVTALPTADALKVFAAGKIAVPGIPQQALTWTDRNGRNVLLLTRELVRDGHGAVTAVVVRVFVVVELGTVVKLLDTVVQKASSLDLVPGLLTVVDRDRDGLAEVTVGLVIKAVAKLDPVTLITVVLCNGKDYVLRATGLPKSVVAPLDPATVLSLPAVLLTPVLQALPLQSDWPGGTYPDALDAVQQYLYLA